jgi:phasin
VGRALLRRQDLKLMSSSLPRRFDLPQDCSFGNGVRLPERKSEESDMSQPKFEVPDEVRNMAEKTIEQAEKAFCMFLDAANKSLASIPLPTTEMSKKALSFTEQNMKAAFDHAKKVVQTTDLQEAMRIQSEFLKTQFTNASEQIKKITGEVMSAAKDATKDKS